MPPRTIWRRILLRPREDLASMAALAGRQDRENRQSALHLRLRPTNYSRYHGGRESFRSLCPPSLTTRNNYQEPNKRVLLKDMTYHIIPPSHSPNAIAPSLQYLFSSNDLPNPTLLPNSLLHTFQFVFLIRKPSASIPSLYRCFIPPLSEKTDEDTLDPSELGYRETRLLFDHLPARLALALLPVQHHFQKWCSRYRTYPHRRRRPSVPPGLHPTLFVHPPLLPLLFFHALVVHT